MAFFDSELENLGDQSTIGGVIQSWGNQLQDQLINSLHKYELLDTGDLQQSIRFEIDIEGDLIRFQLFFDDYGSYLDEGVTGVGGKKADGSSWRKKRTKNTFRFDKTPSGKPPVNFSSTTGRSLRQWAERKGLSVYAVRESIWRQGIEQREWFTDVIETNPFQFLSKDLERVGAKALEIDVSELLKGSINA